MTPEQENHLKGIIDEFASMCDAKYRVGQKEHGGDLFAAEELYLIEAALKETIDQYVYLITLRDKILGRM